MKVGGETSISGDQSALALLLASSFLQVLAVEPSVQVVQGGALPWAMLE
jgi:hypothetical protein